MAEEEQNCGCDYPEMYARHGYEGNTLTHATASCKNCHSSWKWSIEEKKWIKNDILATQSSCGITESS